MSDHLPRDGPEQMKGAPHRDVDGSLEAGQVGLVERLPIAVCGVADGDVKLSELAHDAADHLLDRPVVRHIGLQRKRSAT